MINVKISEMTIKTACLQSLRDLNKTATVREIYEHIIERGYCDFTNSKTPLNTLHRDLGILFNEGEIIRAKAGTYYLKGNEEMSDLPEIKIKKTEIINDSNSSVSIVPFDMVAINNINDSDNIEGGDYFSLFHKLSNKRKKDAEVLLDWEYRGIWETAIKKYSAKAHFIYELLQNADDVRATWVEFGLEPNGFWFKHNGKNFSISDTDTTKTDTNSGKLGDLNAITSIGNSSKIDDQKIGKFGIGFKSVFAYSSTPEIYDDNFNFKLENYIIPIEIEPILENRRKGETLFYFPFNHDAKSKEDAYFEIEEKLMSIFQPILFLNCLEKINWASANNSGEYSKKIIRSERFPDTESSLLEVTSIRNDEIHTENIWLFSRNIIYKPLQSKHKIVVGFFIQNDKKLKTGKQYDAFCFFPTKEKTNLGFIIQAPFMLTDNREGIMAGEKLNIDLIQQLAYLAADTLYYLKEIGIKDKTYLIDDTILDIVPYRETDFTDINNNEKISFKPFYDSILNKFKNEQIVPGRLDTGKYYESNKAYWLPDTRITEIFSDEQVSTLMDNADAGWVFISKWLKAVNAVDKTLEKYIRSVVKECLELPKILKKITSKFIEQQSDEWILKFYAYLNANEHQWDIAKKIPIILNQDRKAVTP